MMYLKSFSFFLAFVYSFAYAEPSDTVRANHYMKKAEAFSAKSGYDSAIANCRRALVIYQGHSLWLKQTEVYNLLAENFKKISNYDESIKCAQQALQISNQHLEKNNEEEARAFSALGNAYGFKGDYTRSLEMNNKALSILIHIYGDHHPRVAKTYQDIRFVYYFIKDLTLALEYDNKALLIFKENYESNHPAIASCYMNIGNIYSMMNENDKAFINFDKALSIYKVRSEDPLAIGGTYNSLAILYKRKGELQKALEYHQKGLSVYKSIVGERHPFVGLYYRNIGDVYRLMEKKDLTVEYYLKSIAVLKNIFGEKHQAICATYVYLARMYDEQGDYDHSLLYFHLGAVANTFNFSNPDPYTTPTVSNCLGIGDQWIVINGKAMALMKKYENSKKLTDLKFAYSCYQVLDSLLDLSRDAARNENDKVIRGEFSVMSYEGGIDASLKLHQISHDPHYLAMAFYFSEKNKVGTLKQMMRDIAAKRIGIIPDELLSLEKRVKANKSSLQSALLQEKNKTVSDTAKMKDLTSQLFDINRQFDSLTNSLEKNYPQYYELKYQHTEIGLSSLQRQIKRGSMVLEYFEGVKNIYVFAITSDQCHTFTIPNDSVFSDQLTNLRKALVLDEHANPTTATKSFTQFNESAFGLYNLLVKNSFENIKQKSDITTLIIIPDGRLNYIPFDVLLQTEASVPVGNYADLKYLIKDYTIAYGYSATLTFEENAKARTASSKRGLISFAPSYEKPDSVHALALGRLRDDVLPLKWNQKEVITLSGIMNNDHFLASEATESQFKKMGGQYNVIHLAMHALIDDEDPMNSKLVFSNQTDSTEDSYLHAFELYNMELHAQLVVLSACNTGYGTLRKGEGLMSLARAFAYAGIPSVVMTQWKVDDHATGELMEYFYQNLAEGMNKSEALRKAKLKYLSTANPAAAHPFFWASFVNIGDDRPVIESSNYWYWFIGLVMLLVLFSVVWKISRKSKIVHT